MTNRKSRSSLPEGDFTWNTGSNYGLDGFHHDTQYGEGTAEGARSIDQLDIQHPQSGGMSHLPDGVATAGYQGLELEAPDMIERHEDAFDLTSFLGEGDIHDDYNISAYFSAEEGLEAAVSQVLKDGALDESPLSDLAWLDPMQGQDPSRLPSDAHDSLTKLEETWARTDPSRVRASVHSIPHTQDREAAAYFQSLDPDAAPRSAHPLEGKVAHGKIKAVIQSALRRSSYGEPLSVIALDTQTTLGSLAPQALGALERVAEDYGLEGNVFIRASAFPGLENGKWAKEIKRKASGARYLLAIPGTTLASHEVFLGKQVVAEVPWEEAYAHYASRLKATGHKVAHIGDPRELLKSAFLSGPAPELLRRTAEDLPVQVAPSDTISLVEAQEAFASMPVEEFDLESKRAQQTEQEHRTACVRLATWVKARMLVKEDAQRIVASGADPRAMLDGAAKLIMASQRSVYAGVGEGQLNASEMTREAAWEQLAHAGQLQAQKQLEVEAAMRRKLEVNVAQWQDVGQITSSEARTLLAIEKPAHEVFGIASALINDQSRHRNAALPEAAPVKPYEGPQFTDHHQGLAAQPQWSPREVRMASAAKQNGVKVAEISTLLRWARIHMTEGSLGNELDMLTKARFSAPLRKAAFEFLEEVRNDHEGLSGHVYVDASAYASREGVVGCEKGSLVHRRNGLKFVLAMDRCGSCAFNNDDTCSKYTKMLVAEVPLPDPVSYQVEAIRMANASDAEVTASLFNTYTNDFDLGNSALDDIDLNASTDVETLGGVLWGGLNIDL